MEKCHLTYSYIFTPWVPELLLSQGFDLTREPDSNGVMAHDIWLTTADGLFCARLIEIIDETSLSDRKTDSPLMPGFAPRAPEPPKGLKPKFQLKGFVFQAQDPAPESPEWLPLPAPVYRESPESALGKLLSYRKASPYWALVVQPESGKPPPLTQQTGNRLSWRDQDVLWLQLETTCWDILILI